ncbi:hypothetical protein PHMEG_0008143 [Phytophthora megakarya]|uniref:Uncharacterized protein n=1 Tax=Phytophthora megakarya TaxID=4795 RepID=A0A225WLH4_9STRA|nr:hypothetical protein PHMEG_0008143 [Phytophthora megakarya]
MEHVGSPFATVAEDDSDEVEKGQRRRNPGPDCSVRQGHLTHQDSGASEPSSRKTTPTKEKGSLSSSRKVPDQPQLRPSGWAPSANQARSPSNQLIMSLWCGMPFVLTMRTGIGYQGSIAMLSGDVMTHNLFPPSAFAAMLASMMVWNRMFRAELRLDLLHSEGVRPGYWPDLVDADVRLAQEVMDDASREHDDTQHDANYTRMTMSTTRMLMTSSVATVSLSPKAPSHINFITF